MADPNNVCEVLDDATTAIMQLIGKILIMNRRENLIENMERLRPIIETISKSHCYPYNVNANRILRAAEAISVLVHVGYEIAPNVDAELDKALALDKGTRKEADHVHQH